MHNFSLLVLTLFLLISFSVSASTETDVEFIISAKNPPKGVVFEVIAAKESALKPALEKIEGYIKRLKAAIPEIKLSVVTHGVEEFALLKENKKRFKESHQKVQSLVSADVPVHVCGTHASWYSYADDDFPDYVAVAIAGPEKVREYQQQGYALIDIRVP